MYGTIKRDLLRKFKTTDLFIWARLAGQILLAVRGNFRTVDQEKIQETKPKWWHKKCYPSRLLPLLALILRTKLIHILLKWKYIQCKSYVILAATAAELFWPYFVKKSFVLITRAGGLIWETFIPLGNSHPVETGTARHYQKKNLKLRTYKEGGWMPTMIYSVILQNY